MPKIPNKIDTLEELKVYFLQYGLKAHGFDPNGLDGIEGGRTKQALADAYQKHTKTAKVGNVPAYAHYALQHVGLSEVTGSRSNKTILGWIKSFFPWAKDDGQLAWCAIFINMMLKQAGIKGTGKANARSFLKWGRKVSTPHKGDIVVFWRSSPNSWKGHVGIYWGEAGDGYIWCLGGNQRNRVSIAKYAKSRVLAYRRHK